VHYDPMIAKVIAHAETHEAAIDRMRAALADFRILGVPTNIAFLMTVLDSPAFRAGRIHTAYLDEDGAGLAAAPAMPAAAFAAAVVHADAARRTVPADPRPASVDPWAGLADWKS